MNINTLLCIFLIFPSIIYSKINDTIHFNQKIYQKKLSYISKDYSQDYIIGGKYKCKFKIVLHFKKNNPQPTNIAVIPINSDSVILGRNVTCDIISKVKTIGYKNNTYKIVELDSLYQYIVIKEIKSLKNSDISLFNSNIKNIHIKNLKGKEVNLTKYLEKDKLLYLDFWGLWCQQCIEDFP